MVRKALPGPAGALLLAGLLLAARPLAAELKPSVQLTTLGTLTRCEGEASFLGLAKASLNLASEGNPNVKGFLQLDSRIGNGVSLSVPRAWVRVRFPLFRVTAGKTRVSWGDGFLFNAGDVIFGSMDVTEVDLSSAVLRDLSDWLLALYLPLDSFSFIEGVVLPYGGRPAGLTTEAEDLLEPVDLAKVSAGARAGAKLGPLTAEAGYLYHGLEGSHRPYLSLHGLLLVNWNLSASLDLPVEAVAWGELYRYASLSAGAFHLASLSGGGTLVLRLEAGLRGDGSWKEPKGGAQGFGSGETYGLFLFPELVYAPVDNLSWQLRALVSPLDLSAVLLAGVDWQVYQGLTVRSQLSAMLGDSNDLFSWERDYGLAWTLGLEFIY